MQEMYKYNISEFDHEGLSKIDRKFFPELIKEWEIDFHQQFSPCSANFLFSNYATMSLIDRSLGFGNKEKSGMELINGEIDVETHLKMEAHSRYQTIYAIGSEIQGNEDEPIFLVIDDKLADGIVWLKYIDDIEGEGDEVPEPVNSEKKKVIV